MPKRYLKIGSRIVVILAFPEGIYVQEVYPDLGREVKFPYEPWMKYVTKPSLYPLS